VFPIKFQEIRSEGEEEMRTLFPLFSLLVLLSLVLAACGTPAATPTAAPAETEAPTTSGGERLQAVINRGQLICGVHGTFQGFGFVDSDGNWTGFDVDFCRAWAAALFDDPNAVEFRGLSAQERFTALQSGEVDVLARNSTWTSVLPSALSRFTMDRRSW
jgi:general L-amino acid transport system substrate-binding protein